MERQDYINQINSLQATIKNLLSMIDTLRQTLESVNASSKRNEEVVKKLSAQIEAYQKQIRNLEDRDKRHNKNTFGQKTHKAKKRVDEKRELPRGLGTRLRTSLYVLGVRQFMETMTWKHCFSQPLLPNRS